jgi:hypothetical protein
LPTNVQKLRSQLEKLEKENSQLKEQLGGQESLGIDDYAAESQLMQFPTGDSQEWLRHVDLSKSSHHARSFDQTPNQLLSPHITPFIY